MGVQQWSVKSPSRTGKSQRFLAKQAEVTPAGPAARTQNKENKEIVIFVVTYKGWHAQE